MTTKVETLHAISEEHIKDCLNIREIVFINEQSVPFELERENEHESEHFLAQVDGVPLGTGRIRIKGSFAKFERIATLKESRGLGIGKALMEKMTEYAQQKFPYHLPMMHAQSEAIGFYEKIGWSTIGGVFYEANIPHTMMVFINKNANIDDLLVWKKGEGNIDLLNFLKRVK